MGVATHSATARAGIDAGGLRRRPTELRPARRLPIAFLVALVAWPCQAAGAPRLLDSFEDATLWTAAPASGVWMKLSADAGAVGRALRVDFDFQKGGGYAVLRRRLDLDLPANYRISFRVRGETAPQDLELKLIDTSGENVWWKNRRGFAYPRAWQMLATRKRQIEFAWGPLGGGEIRHVAALEFAITAGSGGRGTVWFDQLEIEALEPPAATPKPPMARASSAAPGHDPARALDGDPATGWRSRAQDLAPWLELDLGPGRELGGLSLEWAPLAHPQAYEVQVSDDGRTWRSAARVRGGDGGRDWFQLPELETRRLRIAAGARELGQEIELREARLLPLAVGESANAFYRVIARASPRGFYPRGMLGEPSFWTVVGTPDGKEESLFAADGAIDFGAGRPSLEPFLVVGEKLWTWADVTAEQSLDGGELPLPAVTWKGAPVELRIAAIPYRHVGAGFTRVTYRVRNAGAGEQTGTLYLALRPFQVNPPSQFLNTQGGVCELRTIHGRGGEMFFQPGSGWVQGPPVTGFGASGFDRGDVVEYIARDRLPPESSATDSAGRASAGLAHRFVLAPGDTMVVALDLMLSRPVPPGASPFPLPLEPALERRAREEWRAALGPAEIHLPPGAAEVERTLLAQIGWILVNRDSAALQPGSRAYARSWIRDGALTATALMRFGRHDDARRFLEWFAPYQYEDGKVPCCVDRRGSDPVPEHDSHGELIYLAAEYFRHTGDRATIERLWPRLAAAAAYIDTLRRQRLGPEWSAEDKREFRGILPPSISHEGYSAKPMHSYWDDFWALRGLEDAAFMARALGRAAEARDLGGTYEEFRRDLGASIAAAMRSHDVTYVPGCADLGDFDATSTTIALSPVQAEAVPPPGAIEATFERYWQNFVKRRDGSEKWEAYTPYEIRNIGAFVRLGWRGRANELLDWFMPHRSPPGWAQWPEVVWNHPDSARFVGDIPHTWVGSDFVRSVLDMLAYEHDADSTLVLAAGVPDAWVRDSSGVAVRGLSTHYGPLSYTLRYRGDVLEARIEAGLRVPPGGIVVAPPVPQTLVALEVRVNGAPANQAASGGITVHRLPADVRWSSRASGSRPGRR